MQANGHPPPPRPHRTQIPHDHNPHMQINNRLLQPIQLRDIPPANKGEPGPGSSSHHGGGGGGEREIHRAAAGPRAASTAGAERIPGHRGLRGGPAAGDGDA